MKTILSEENQCYFKQLETMSTPAIILANPKYPHNVGQAFRVCSGFLMPQLWVSGERILNAVHAMGRIPREERMKGYRDVDLVWDEDPMSKVPEDAITVAVECFPPGQAENLFEFNHPENAVYVFGPEDGSLDRTWTTKCKRRVTIDTAFCMNLANAVSTILYDRAMKDHLKRNPHLLDAIIANKS